jgi:cytochrome P450
MDGRSAHADAQGGAARVHAARIEALSGADPRVRARARAGLPDRECDAFAHFTDPLPLYVMAELLGVSMRASARCSSAAAT